MRMTDKQARFCEEYMVDLNATQAAIRAGYSPASAKTVGPRLLENVGVQKLIAQLQAEQSRRTGVSTDRVVRELAKIAFVNAADLIDPKTASLKSDASHDDLAAVQSVKVKMFGEDGLEQEVKLADKLRALDLLGAGVVKVFGGRETGESTSRRPGTILSADKRGIRVACGDGKVLCLTELQAPGSRRMSAADYLRGHPVSAEED